jgi:CRP/FNR family transcriptional regulator, cyclic AMP receptor protein
MATATEGDLLLRVPLIAALTDSDRQALARTATRRRYQRGDLIFQKDDPGQTLFIVASGSVRIYVPSSQGADLTLAVFGPGNFFGDLSLLDGRPRSASAAALTDTNVVALERSDFVALIRSRPEAAMSVLATVASRLRETDEMASDLAFLDVGGRLAKKLLDLAATNGVRRRDGVMLDMALTQEELANMIGVTRESVNRNLSLFRRIGLIGKEGRRFILRNPAGLRQRCE